MTGLNKILLQRLRDKGVASSEVYRLIKDVAVMISARHPTDLGLINRKLQTMGWQRLELDARTLELIVAGFKQAGQTQMDPQESVDDPAGLQQLIDKIYHERGIDFRGYSHSSLSRRFARRLRDCGVAGYAEYLPLLDKNPKEYERLINSIFVTVTRFFRNKAAFQALTRALERAFDGSADRRLTIWSAGCATGQEPYTIAMLAANLMAASQGREILILATDIDDAALDIARSARFSKEEIRDVPESWQDRYFEKAGSGYILCQAVQSLVTFQHHNLVSDRPLEDLDIIVCRNVLIYFNLALQMRVVEKLYNSLRPKGHLLLGRYEMLIKQARRQFSCVDFDARLYRKKQGPL